MSKLYEVRLEYSAYVLAEDEADAKSIAEDELCITAESDKSYALNITKSSQIKTEWRDAIPFALYESGDRELTCDQWMQEHPYESSAADLEAAGQLRLDEVTSQ